MKVKFRQHFDVSFFNCHSEFKIYNWTLFSSPNLVSSSKLSSTKTSATPSSSSPSKRFKNNKKAFLVIPSERASFWHNHEQELSCLLRRLFAWSMATSETANAAKKKNEAWTNNKRHTWMDFRSLKNCVKKKKQ